MCCHIDGVSTLELAQKYDTPLFAFSENRINHNVKKTSQHLNRNQLPLKGLLCREGKCQSRHTDCDQRSWKRHRSKFGRRAACSSESRLSS